MGFEGINIFDFHFFWTWFLLFTRFSGIFMALPGIGTEEVPLTIRLPLTMIIAGIVTACGAHAEFSSGVPEGMLMIITEFLLGYLLGAIPAFIVSALSLSGQVSATAIGLNQASIIDPSLGEHVTTLARIQGLIATSLFLLINGHHVILRAGAEVSKDIGVGIFRPDGSTVELFLNRFAHMFEIAISIAAPIIVVTLITQFVLGLLTRFVPQVNVFIMSLPLTILVGMFVFGFTLPEMARHIEREFYSMEETATQLLTGR